MKAKFRTTDKAMPGPPLTQSLIGSYPVEPAHLTTPWWVFDR